MGGKIEKDAGERKLTFKANFPKRHHRREGPRIPFSGFVLLMSLILELYKSCIKKEIPAL